MKILVVVRGVPGARKTTLANELDHLVHLAYLYSQGIMSGARVFSEDDFWTSADGIYNYDPATTHEAFELMFSQARGAIDSDVPVIILATALLSLRDPGMLDLVGAAKAAGYSVFPILLQRDVSYPPSIHDVSEPEMHRFRSQMEHDLEVDFAPRAPVHHRPGIAKPACL